MTSSSTTPANAAPTTRTRVVETAVTLTAEIGWSHVTMAKLAERAGVSRQTVYNEMGTKAGLAEAMVLHELARFLGEVHRAFDEHPDDLVTAIRDASHHVLVHARDNELIRTVVSATHGADTELLPLLTTHADSLIDIAGGAIRERIAGYDVPLRDHQLDAAIDMVVRVTLSHVIQPRDDPATTADGIAWVAARVLC